MGLLQSGTCSKPPTFRLHCRQPRPAIRTPVPTSSGSATSPPIGGDEIPVPVESIAEDLLGLRIEEDDLGECSGMLIPTERLILVNASEAMSGDTPTRRHRFTIAHELGHWICHAHGRGVRADLLPLAGRLAGHRPHPRARGERLRRRAADAGGSGARGVGGVPGRGGGRGRFDVSALAAQWRLYSSPRLSPSSRFLNGPVLNRDRRLEGTGMSIHEKMRTRKQSSTSIASDLAARRL